MILVGERQCRLSDVRNNSRYRKGNYYSEWWLQDTYNRRSRRDTQRKSVILVGERQCRLSDVRLEAQEISFQIKP